MQKIENLNIRPISQLIYLKYNVNNSKILKFKINKTIDKRLKKDYHLNKTQAKMLLSFEKHTIKESLSDRKDCTFVGEHSLSNTLDIIYSKLAYVEYDDEETYKEELDNLSLSELALVNYISTRLAKSYKKRTTSLLQRLRSGEVSAYDALETAVNMQKFHHYLAEGSKNHFLNQPYFTSKKQAMNQFKKEQEYMLAYNKNLLSQEVIGEINIIKNNQEALKLYQKVAKRK